MVPLSLVVFIVLLVLAIVGVFVLFLVLLFGLNMLAELPRYRRIKSM